MCLDVTKNTRVRTVKKERTVYKIVGEIDNKMYSFYQQMRIKLNVPLKVDKKLKIIKGWARNYVDRGFHSFKNVDDAIYILHADSKWGLEQGFEALHIYECKIPVGARIIKGIFSYKNLDSYVSSEVFYNKIVYTETYL